MKNTANSDKQIIIGADHRGASLAHSLQQYFKSQNWHVQMFGSATSGQKVDYPIVAKEAAQQVVLQKIPAILICGNGVGMSMAANKVRGIRAALTYKPEDVSESRKKDNANVLCLPASIDLELAIRLIELFVSTQFDEVTYGARVELLDQCHCD